MKFKLYGASSMAKKDQSRNLWIAYYWSLKYYDNFDLLMCNVSINVSIVIYLLMLICR
jgi:hypothetical protein